jgi:hypothetical protein
MYSRKTSAVRIDGAGGGRRKRNENENENEKGGTDRGAALNSARAWMRDQYLWAMATTSSTASPRRAAASEYIAVRRTSMFTGLAPKAETAGRAV